VGQADGTCAACADGGLRAAKETSCVAPTTTTVAPTTTAQNTTTEVTTGSPAPVHKVEGSLTLTGAFPDSLTGADLFADTELVTALEGGIATAAGVEAADVEVTGITLADASRGRQLADKVATINYEISTASAALAATAASTLTAAKTTLQTSAVDSFVASKSVKASNGGVALSKDIVTADVAAPEVIAPDSTTSSPDSTTKGNAGVLSFIYALLFV
jgi:hypothetical protein